MQLNNQTQSVGSFVKQLNKEVLNAVFMAGGDEAELVKQLTIAVSKAKGRPASVVSK